jgi:Calcineurin-like phosphoesterase
MSNFLKFIFASDVHGDHQDIAVNKALFAFKKTWKPDISIAGGDIYDFRPIRKKAGIEEQMESMKNDLDAGTCWLKMFQPTVFLRGNHDERLWDEAKKNNGLASDFARQEASKIEALMASFKAPILPYNVRDGIYRIGNLKAIHGFYCGATAARKTALAYGSVLMGHGHCIDHAPIEGLERRMGRMCGALCKLDPDYSRASVGSLRQAHGWAYGVINKKTGDYQVWQAEKIGDKFLLATGFETF